MSRQRIHRKLLLSHLGVALLLFVVAAGLAPVMGAARALVFALLAATGAALAIDALVRRRARALEELAEAVRALPEGGAARLPEAGGDDELEALAAAVAESGGRLAGSFRTMRAEADKLRTVLDGMSEGVALLARGRIALANPAFRRLLEIESPVEGRTALEAVRRSDVAEAIAAAGRRGALETRDISVPSGRVLQLRAEPLAADAAVVVLLDVTEARSLERMRREFVANASHELRTPVAAILAVAETLGAARDMAPADRARFERILLSHTGRLARLVDDLLDLSRAEAAPTPSGEPVALDGPLASALEQVRARAESRGIRLESSIAPSLPRLIVDATALEQVLSNLLDNAVKYTPDGGRVEVRASLIDGGASPMMVRIEVEDTGVGIPPEHLPRIFERFYRVDPARSRALGGTGLGLAIVKHLVQAHGGDTTVSSTVGVGSTFRVTLPAER